LSLIRQIGLHLQSLRLLVVHSLFQISVRFAHLEDLLRFRLGRRFPRVQSLKLLLRLRSHIAVTTSGLSPS
jgi:hypothetical protein